MRNTAPRIAMLMRRLLGSISKLDQTIRRSKADAREDARKRMLAEVTLPQGIETRKCAVDATEESEYQRRIFLVSLGSLVVALLTLVAIIWYACLVRRQWIEMQKTTKATREAAGAAAKAADTADQNLKNSKEVFRIEQRPYLIVDPPQFVEGTFAPGKPQANVTFRNIGKTPAIKIRRQVALLQFRPYRKKGPIGTERFLEFIQPNFKKLNDKIDVTNAEKYADLAREDLAPNASTFSTAELENPISASEVAEIKRTEETLLLYLISETKYSDAYGGEYETQFCSYYVGPDPRIWHVCDNHNIIK